MVNATIVARDKRKQSLDDIFTMCLKILYCQYKDLQHYYLNKFSENNGTLLFFLAYDFLFNTYSVLNIRFKISDFLFKQPVHNIKINESMNESLLIPFYFKRLISNRRETGTWKIKL